MISFYLSYLIDSLTLKDKVTMVDPAAVSCLKFCADDEELHEMFDLLQLDRFELVLVPLNNSTSLKTSGDHWTLLACYKDSAYLLDSSQSSVS